MCVMNNLGRALLDLPGPILITGHTGFKGAWLTLLLTEIGVPVIGYSLRPEKDSLFERAGLKGQIPEVFSDIRKYKKLSKFMTKHQPSVVIHMAAQPLVLESFKFPLETFDINVMGTANVINSSFETPSVRVVLAVTTDKVYKNNNLEHRFVESDPLEGKDPYSASKVGAEAVITAWQLISKVSNGPAVVSVRAGNVIGGGDIAENRLIPDIIRAYQSGKILKIRNPSSTRPWQHVLDVLNGYILTAEACLNGTEINSVNFGPKEKSLTVNEVIEICKKYFNFDYAFNEHVVTEYKQESKYLELNPNYASTVLNWSTKIDQALAIKRTLEWWDKVLNQNKSTKQVCIDEIQSFLTIV